VSGLGHVAEFAFLRSVGDLVVGRHRGALAVLVLVLVLVLLEDHVRVLVIGHAGGVLPTPAPGSAVRRTPNILLANAGEISRDVFVRLLVLLDREVAVRAVVLLPRGVRDAVVEAVVHVEHINVGVELFGAVVGFGSPLFVCLDAWEAALVALAVEEQPCAAGTRPRWVAVPKVCGEATGEGVESPLILRAGKVALEPLTGGPLVALHHLGVFLLHLGMLLDRLVRGE
jgi:hypothetical protein